jgi:hypothetical protein
MKTKKLRACNANSKLVPSPSQIHAARFFFFIWPLVDAAEAHAPPVLLTAGFASVPSVRIAPIGGVLASWVARHAIFHLAVVDENMRRELAALEEPVANEINIVGDGLHGCAAKAAVIKARGEEDAVLALGLFLAWGCMQ